MNKNATSQRSCKEKMSVSPAPHQYCTTKANWRMSPSWCMPSPVVACMCMLCSPYRRLAYGRCQRKGWHDGPTARTVRRHCEAAGPRPPVPRRECRGGRVCRGAEPAALWRGVFPRGSAPECGAGVAARTPGPWHPRALPAGAGRRACGPRVGARGPIAARRVPQASGADESREMLGIMLPRASHQPQLKESRFIGQALQIWSPQRACLMRLWRTEGHRYA